MKKYPDVRCFLLQPTDRYRLELRRFTYTATSPCPANPYGCDASVVLGVEVHAQRPTTRADDPARFPHDDARWPQRCAACGTPFPPTASWQVNYEQLHTRSDGGPECTLRDPPPGAMWEAPWAVDFGNRGADGRCFVVRLPNGRDWMIDGRASNCSKPDDHAHNCWVRHGTPPLLTVDKAGVTCNAGAGSIGSGTGADYYHGFLRDGVLVGD
jgi:hypothetical protein